MTDYNLQEFSEKLDELIECCEQLRQDNQALLEREHEWLEEKARLVEKNELARSRVESMIEHLKSLKEGVG